MKLVGGRVVDGSGAPAVKMDVAVTDGRISALGDLGSLEAARTLDCTGRTIVPGFIDIHSHSDWLVPGADHGALIEPFIRMGMTSLVGGNCGFSPAPLTEHNRHAAHEASQLIVDAALDLPWSSMHEFLAALEQSGVALNVAQLVGHGAVRAAVTGPLTMDAPKPDELAQMERLTKEGLDAGCCGVSTGLGYPPGIFSQEPELTAFASWAARDDKLFTSHLKAYSWQSPVFATDPAESPHNIEAIREILRVGAASGARVQISHLIFVGRNTWPNHADALRVIDKARASGLDVAFDAFPYTAGNTTASVLFPPPILPRLEEVLASEDEFAGLKALGEHVFSQIGFHLEDIQIMNANAATLNEFNGMFVGDAARQAGMGIWEFYARMVIESRQTARVLIHTYSGHRGDEDALRAVLAHPLCTIETDTFLTQNGHQNPASYGTFPRVLSTYVEAGLFPFEEAIHKMTGAAASRLGWTDRGQVKRGWAADLVVLNPDTLADTASFEEPARFPTGIEHVFINGTHVIEGDTYNAHARAGIVLRQ